MLTIVYYAISYCNRLAKLESTRKRSACRLLKKPQCGELRGYICMYVCIYIYIYVYMYACVYIYIYIYIYMYIHMTGATYYVTRCSFGLCLRLLFREPCGILAEPKQVKDLYVRA